MKKILPTNDLHGEFLVVEVFFNKLKHFRRIATRYDKLSSLFQAFVIFACIMIWLE